jgi:hypothetical protein
MATGVVIPAWNEAERICDTVAAAMTLGDVDIVVVVCDGCTDHTALRARATPAVVIELPRRHGKAAAMVRGAEILALADKRDGCIRRLLFLDADLGASAAGAQALIEAVATGNADMTIGRLPRQEGGGGHGIAVRFARSSMQRLVGWAPQQPLSGQRCITREMFDRVRPLAPGFGVETGLTIDVRRAGGDVLEVDVPLQHRVTGNDVRSQLHRARQFVDIARAVVVRELPPPLRQAVRAALRNLRRRKPVLVRA